jgi:hypothetical protein
MTSALKEKSLLAKPCGLDVAQAVEHRKYLAVFQNSGTIVSGR